MMNGISDKLLKTAYKFLTGVVFPSGQRLLFGGKAGYETFLLVNRYAPWRTDKEFLRVYEKIKDFTLVDIYRCYELWRLAGEAGKCAAGDLLEVGVWRGGTGTLIAARAAGSAPGSTVFLCDTFSGVVKAGTEDSTYSGGEHSDTSEAVVEKLAAGLELRNVKILKGTFPEETGRLIEGRTFRFCHIDVDVFESTRGIFLWAWDRLEVGGVVVFDDYGSASCDGVMKYINSITPLDGCVFIYNLNGHAVFAKTKKTGTSRTGM